MKRSKRKLKSKKKKKEKRKKRKKKRFPYLSQGSKEDPSEPPIHLEINSSSPSLLSILFLNPLTKELASLDIEIGPGGSIAASLSFPKKESDFCPSDWISKVFFLFFL